MQKKPAGRILDILTNMAIDSEQLLVSHCMLSGLLQMHPEEELPTARRTKIETIAMARASAAPLE
jgi:hypothetical protein